MYQQEHSVKGFEFGYGKSSIPSNDYHVHNSYEIFYLIDGNSEYFIDNSLFSVYPGNVVFISPNTIHRNRYISKDYERIVINFSDDYIEPSIAKASSDLFTHKIFEPKNMSFIKNLFSGIQREWDKLLQGDDISSSIIKSNINTLLAHFIRCEKENYVHKASISNPSIDRLVQCINMNYHMPITLSFAAELLHMSPAYLSVLFQENTGFGFKEYIINVRIKNACSKLINTKNSIQDIAYSCGFNDSNYFSTMFKKVIGLSPLQYRKKYLDKI